MIELRFERVDLEEFEVFSRPAGDSSARDEFLGWMRADRLGVWKFKSTDDSISVVLCRNEKVAQHRLAATLSVLRAQSQRQKERARDS